MCQYLFFVFNYRYTALYKSYQLIVLNQSIFVKNNCSIWQELTTVDFIISYRYILTCVQLWVLLIICTKFSWILYCGIYCLLKHENNIHNRHRHARAILTVLVYPLIIVCVPSGRLAIFILLTFGRTRVSSCIIGYVIG